MKERRDSLLKQTQKMCQIVLKHVVVMKAKHSMLEIKTLRERTVRPVVDHDNLSHEQTMLNEVNMDFRMPGLPHSVVKHAQSTSVRELIQKIENHPDRLALKQDLRQNPAYHSFSPESKKMNQEVATSNCLNCSRRIPKRSAQHACHTGTQASSVAHACITCRKKQRIIEISINIRWTFFHFQSVSSRSEDLMATDMGKSQETNNIIWLIN